MKAFLVSTEVSELKNISIYIKSEFFCPPLFILVPQQLVSYGRIRILDIMSNFAFISELSIYLPLHTLHHKELLGKTGRFFVCC